MKDRKLYAVAGISGAVLAMFLTSCQQAGQMAAAQTESNHTMIEVAEYGETNESAESGAAAKADAEQADSRQSGQSATGQASRKQDGQSASGQPAISADEAENTALTHAGVVREDIEFIRVDREWDNGQEEYEVDFAVDGKEYEYEISAQTGKILSYSVENMYEKEPPRETDSAVQTSQGPISMEEAKQIAAAQIGGISVNDIYMKRDYDHGQTIYEGEAYSNGTKYEFDIDGASGEILAWKSEMKK